MLTYPAGAGVARVSVLLLAIATVPAIAATPRPATRPGAAAAEPGYGRAEAIPEDMIRQRPRNTMLLPSEPGEFGEDPAQLSGGVIGAITPETHRLPEGFMVSNGKATITRSGAWRVCVLPREVLFEVGPADTAGMSVSPGTAPVPAGLVRAFERNGRALPADATSGREQASQPLRIQAGPRSYLVEHTAGRHTVRAAVELRLLPNKRLAMLEALLGSTAEQRDYLVTGRVTEFQGGNYLLLEHLVEEVDAPAPPPTVRPQSTPADAVATDSRPSDAGFEPQAEEIIAELMRTRPRQAVVMPDQAPVPREAGAGGGQLLEATILNERPGRLIAAEADKWWTLAFEDRGLNPGNKPMRLLPNRLLETAIALSDGGAKSTVFVVSGEITEYHGVNYLLLRKVLVHRSFGNLH